MHRRLLLLGLLGLPVCADAAPPLFEDDIRPLLKAHCVSCHGEEARLEGALDVRQRRSLQTGGDSGPAIVPGRRADSLLYRRIAAGEMPPPGKTPLSAAQREVIGRWIDSGAPARSAEPDLPDEYGLTAADRAFWSFQPLRRPPLPAVRNTSWTEHPIDVFVLSQLEAANLTPSPRAAPRDLVRRLSFALLGLPPATDDVEQFERDSSPGAYAALVDRYLASPQFGERWSRLWLDLVRYVDQTPDYLNSAERAWLYRDWVIRAFNADRPYEDFLRLQLAADLLDNVAPDDLAALGLLGLSPTYWKELRLSPEVIKTVVAEEWDERIDVVTRTFLGLTVSCARCHDHKYDPVTQRDYTALAGVFASTQLTERPLLPAPLAAQVRAARADVARWEAQVKALNDPTSDVSRELQEAIAARSALPHFADPWAHVVEDAFIDVLPLGDDQTQLAYHAGQTRDLRLFRRGNPSDEGDLTPRRFLAVLCNAPPTPYRHGSGRRELADSLLHEARGLTARVIVNRAWAQLIGRGLVRTTSDFGRQGERPTHPELLEWLAVELAEGRNGSVASPPFFNSQPATLNSQLSSWSLKRLIRAVVLSATFQQSSASRPEAVAVDADNALLWRMNRRRLEIEPWRDAMLAAAGTLDDRMYGPAQPLDAAGFQRRTLYGRIVRDELHTMLRLYDFPEAASHCPNRDPTTTPLQQLFVLNGPLVQEQAAAMNRLREQSAGARALPEQIEWCYRRLFQRSPTPAELSRGIEFLQAHAGYGAPSPNSWTAYLHVLLGLNELLFVD